MIIASALTGTIVQQEVKIASIEPNYDTGIEWTSVGGVWKALDRGPTTAHVSTTLTLYGAWNDLLKALEIMRTNSLSGLPVYLHCESCEMIMGPEFLYDKDYPYSFIFDDPDSSVQVDTNDGLDYNSLTVHLLYAGDVSALPWIYPTPYYLPSGLQVSSMNRLSGSSFKASQQESGASVVGFAYNAPRCEITYFGTKEIIAKTKILFESLRSSTTYISSVPRNTLFLDTWSSAGFVYILDFTDMGPQDMNGSHWALTATFGRA